MPHSPASTARSAANAAVRARVVPCGVTAHWDDISLASSRGPNPCGCGMHKTGSDTATLLNDLLDTANVLVVELDCQGRVIWYNQAVAKLSGRPLSDMEGLDWVEAMVPEAEQEAVRKACASASRVNGLGKNRKPWISASSSSSPLARLAPRMDLVDVAKEIQDADRMLGAVVGAALGARGPRVDRGAARRRARCYAPPRRSIDWFHKPTHGEDGAWVGLICLGHDVSDSERIRDELFASEERAQGVLATAVNAIITISERGVIETVNAATERIFGYDREEMIGKNVSMLMPTPYRERHDGYMDTYKQTGERKIIGIGREVVAMRKDGRVVAMVGGTSTGAIVGPTSGGSPGTGDSWGAPGMTSGASGENGRSGGTPVTSRSRRRSSGCRRCRLPCR